MKTLKELGNALTPMGLIRKFNRMIIVGHSMGGLVSRLQIVDSGNELWHAISSIPFDEYRIAEATRKNIRSAVFFESLPFIRTAVFMATPHRGSSLADKWYTRMFADDVKLPKYVEEAQMHFMASNAIRDEVRRDRPATAVDSLSEQNPMLRAIEKLPFHSGTQIHSIIPIKTSGGKTGGTDGIVPYDSAHLNDAITETIIHSGHSCTRHPAAIREVRRILLDTLMETKEQKSQER